MRDRASREAVANARPHDQDNEIVVPGAWETE
jgi:hypothetical protein